MTEFIPGDEYRIDIVGADERVLVDSWNSQIKGDVIAQSGQLLVDTITGRIYGAFVGDVLDTDGATVFDLGLRKYTGNVQGNVIANDGSVLIDSTDKMFTATVKGNIVDREGNTILDHLTKSIDAISVTADTFYGDLVGSISSESVIYGTFSGDFNGTSYGEFFGDTTGTHTGDVSGNFNGIGTGQFFGKFTGEVLGLRPGQEVATDLIAFDDNPIINQWNFIGGIAHPNPPTDASAYVKGPILTVGETRDKTRLTADIHHYNENTVLHLLQQEPVDGLYANFYGRFVGEFSKYDHNNPDVAPEPVLSYIDGRTSLYAHNGLLQLGMDNTSDIEIQASTIIKKLALTATSDPSESVKTFKTDGVNTQALTNRDLIYTMDVEAYNGNGFVEAGSMAFFVDETDSINPNGSSMPTGFAISLADSTFGTDETKSTNLEFNNKGVLSVPVFKAKGTTFAGRDSMIAEPGMIIFNTSNKKFQGYTGTAWVDLH